MELSSQAQQFFVDRFGYNPEAVSITRPDGVTDTAYLIGGREGFQPWPAKQVEAYVLSMQECDPGITPEDEAVAQNQHYYLEAV